MDVKGSREREREGCEKKEWRMWKGKEKAGIKGEREKQNEVKWEKERDRKNIENKAERDWNGQKREQKER